MSYQNMLFVVAADKDDAHMSDALRMVWAIFLDHILSF